MQSAFRVVAASAIIVAASFVIRADATPSSQSSEIQLQLADILFSEGKFLDSLEAYRNALKDAPRDAMRRPRMGVIASALRVAEFGLARIEAERLYQADPTGPDAMTLCGRRGCSRRPRTSTTTRSPSRRISRAATTAWPRRSPRAAGSRMR
jgi:hypothetical protein